MWLVVNARNEEFLNKTVQKSINEIFGNWSDTRRKQKSLI